MCLGISAATAAIAGGVIGAGGAVGGALISSNAATNAGNAQIAAQQQALQQEIAQRAQTVSQATNAAQMSAGEISSTNQLLTTRDQQLSTQLGQIQKQQTQLDSIDPNVKAAGSDLYNLLTGHASNLIAPLQTQLNNQKTALQSQLASQLGPGYATSSAGIAALTAFDQQSAVTLSQAQQSAVQTATQTYGSLFGAQQGGQGNIFSQTGSAYGAAQQATGAALNEYNSVTARQESAVLGGTGAAPINYGGPASVAGNSFAGAAQLGGGIAGAAQSVGQGFGAAAGYNSFNQALQTIQNKQTLSEFGNTFAQNSTTLPASNNPSQQFEVGKLTG